MPTASELTETILEKFQSNKNLGGFKMEVLARIGAPDPVLHGGGLVLINSKAKHLGELLWVQPHTDKGNKYPSKWSVYRFRLEVCISDDTILYQQYNNKKAAPFHYDLLQVSLHCGKSIQELRKGLCSSDVLLRAYAYWSIYCCYGFQRLDPFYKIYQNEKQIDDLLNQFKPHSPLETPQSFNWMTLTIPESTK